LERGVELRYHRAMQSNPQAIRRPPTLHDTKRALRARVLAARDALSVAAREAADERIAEHVARLPAFERARALLITLNFGSEVSTTRIGQLALARGKILLAPRVNPATKMLDLYEIRDLASDVAKGAWGIPEPRPDACRQATAEEIEWVLVPGIAFDRHGGRLGYGGGYYDRLLPLLPLDTPNAAVAYALQVVDSVPHGRHDLRIETLITEDGPIVIVPDAL
jgi:5-formyltetrahydrofolate cyclo-ligase